MQKPTKCTVLCLVLTGVIIVNAQSGYCALTWNTGKKKVQSPAESQSPVSKKSAASSSKPAAPVVKQPVVDKKAVAAIANNRASKKSSVQTVKQSTPVRSPSLAGIPQNSSAKVKNSSKSSDGSGTKEDVFSKETVVARERLMRVNQQIENIFKVSEKARKNSNVNVSRVQTMVDQARKPRDILGRSSQRAKLVNQRSLASAQLVLQTAKIRQIREQMKFAKNPLLRGGQLPRGGGSEAGAPAVSLKSPPEPRRPG